MSQKLMVSGYICDKDGCTLSTEIKRGMQIYTSEGVEAGKVAAVVLDSQQETAVHLLLERLPEIQGYWLIPVEWIIKVQAEQVHLTISRTEIETLQRWESS